MRNPVLKWTDAHGALRRIELCVEETSMGRRGDSDIVLTDPEVSRCHAKFLRLDDRLYVVDLDSRHGTYVNGRRVTREEIRPGDKISIGRNQFEVDDPEHESAEVAPPLEESQDLRTVLLELTADVTAPSADPSGLEKLTLLLDFEYQWKQQFPAEAMFHKILECALRISGAQRGYILRGEHGEFRYALGLGSDSKKLSETEFRTSRTVVEKVTSTGEPVFMTEGLSHDLARQESIVHENLRAVACLPLIGIGSDRDSNEVLGILYLDSQRTMHALTGLDEKILRRLAGEAGSVLERMALIRRIEERKMMEKELELAQETQLNLLPRSTPDFEGFLVTAFSRATRYVGGDFYDFLVADGSMTAILADVSGKGVSASLLSSSLQGALHMQLRSGSEPEEALHAVNQYLCARTEADRFVTLVLVRVDASGEGSFLSAGHIPSYLFRAQAGEVEELTSRNLILGAFESARYGARPLSMDAGDILFLLSDGLTEALNPAGEMFGEERLVALLRERGPHGSGALKASVLEALDAFIADTDQTDDITFVLIERLHPETPGASDMQVQPPSTGSPAD